MTRILVIDDEPLVREVMLEMLEHAGYEAIGAVTADEALRVLTSQPVSLIVSDMIMPGLSGIDLLELVRARWPSVPVILVTGASTRDNVGEALARGADAVILKPFSHAEFCDAVAAALGSRRPDASASPTK